MDKRQQRKSHTGNEDSINYYKRVSETLEEGFQTTDEKELFLNNVFSQLETEVTDVSQGLVTSHIVEHLIRHCSPHHITSLLKALISDWPNLCCHRFGSHVVQTLVGVLPTVLVLERDEASNNSVEDYKHLTEEIFLQMCAPLLENLDDFLTDVYGSHVLRAVLEVLGGKAVEEQILRSSASRNQKRKNNANKVQFADFQASSAFRKLFKKFAKKIFHAENFSAHLLNGVSNPVLQTVILILNKTYPKRCQQYVQRIIRSTNLFSVEESGEESQKLPDIVQHDIGSFLIEQIFMISDAESLKDTHCNLFKGKLLQFSIHPVANFVLQRFIQKITERETFEEIFCELRKHIEDILAMNCLGVINKIMEGCLKFSCKQSKMLKLLMKAFHCADPVERQCKIVPLLGSLSTYEVFYNIDKLEQSSQTDIAKEDVKSKITLFTEVNYHGARLLQHLLNFSNSKLVVTSLLELKPVELKTLSCDPCGSHVIDAFYNSESVGENSKDALLNRYKGIFMELACTRNGSRTIETIWKCLKTRQKIIVAEELSKQIDRLRSDQFGHFVFYNFAIGHFKNRRDDWMVLQGAGQRKRKLFEDILEDTGIGKTSKMTDKRNVKKETTASSSEEEQNAGMGKRKMFPKPNQEILKEDKQWIIETSGQKDPSSKQFHKKKASTIKRENISYC